MTSDDVGTITLLLEKHFADTKAEFAKMRQDNAEFREQVRQDNAEFRDQIRQDMRNFEDRVNTKIEALDEKFSGKIDVLQSQIAVMQNDITGLKHDVGNLFTWNYWTLSIILVLVAAPQVASGIKSLFGAVAEGLGLIVSAFRKEGRQ